jgi:hypothetical protein
MAPASPPHAAAPRKQSRLNVITDGIKKESELRTHVRSHLARRISLPAQAAASVHDETTSRRQSAPSLPWVSSTDATEMVEDIVEQPEVVCKLEGNEWDFEDAVCYGWRSTTQGDDNCASYDEIDWNKAADCECTDENGELFDVLQDNDEETVWNKAAVSFLEDTEATDQPSEDQFARLGSLDMYWNPCESELIQSTFWDAGMLSSEFGDDEAGI